MRVDADYTFVGQPELKPSSNVSSGLFMTNKSENEKFPAYEFSDLEQKPNENVTKPVIPSPSGFRKWLGTNRMLLVTMSGVFLGVFEGILRVCIFCGAIFLIQVFAEY